MKTGLYCNVIHTHMSRNIDPKIGMCFRDKSYNAVLKIWPWASITPLFISPRVNKFYVHVAYMYTAVLILSYNFEWPWKPKSLKWEYNYESYDEYNYEKFETQKEKSIKFWR